MSEKICAVIVTYNRLEVLKNALTNISQQTRQPEMLMIVDNNSNDGTREYLESLIKPGKTEILFLNNNIGFAGGIARGMKQAMEQSHFDYYWIMDDDSLHKKNTLEELVMHMNGSQFGILGLSGSNIRMGTKHKIIPTQKVQDADYVLIDGALLNGDTVNKIGLPDEKFFMMCEDHEYCKRIKRVGDGIGLLDIGEINRLHLGGGGSFTRATLWRGYYQSRNHILILKEYFTVPDLLGYIFRQAKFIVAAALYAPDRVKRIKLRLIGIWHGIRGIGGKTLDPATLKFI